MEDLFSMGVRGGLLNEETHLSLKQTYTECHSQDTSFPTTKENIVKESHRAIIPWEDSAHTWPCLILLPDAKQSIGILKTAHFQVRSAWHAKTYIAALFLARTEKSVTLSYHDTEILVYKKTLHTAATSTAKKSSKQPEAQSKMLNGAGFFCPRDSMTGPLQEDAFLSSQSPQQTFLPSMPKSM